ncbi:hypothetical protein TNCT_628891 [Trichonephila clavata]|uniref:Uncharacterized protein n=1 Tax=Trichonephila clavata TaxID=2740835 RepID=A0A8X6I6Y8_TRICU|nr:hypothetical protein TNCT_628891 [Trichonephila clavata]
MPFTEIHKSGRFFRRCHFKEQVPGAHLTDCLNLSYTTRDRLLDQKRLYVRKVFGVLIMKNLAESLNSFWCVLDDKFGFRFMSICCSTTGEIDGDWPPSGHKETLDSMTGSNSRPCQPRKE